jgi:hypothetical protein
MRMIAIEEHFLPNEARKVMEKTPSSLGGLFTSSRELQRRPGDLDAQGRFLDDPIFLPILERAVALDVPIYLHPAEPLAAVIEVLSTPPN